MSNDPKSTPVNWDNCNASQSQPSTQSSSNISKLTVSLNESAEFKGLIKNNSLIGHENFTKKDNDKK